MARSVIEGGRGRRHQLRKTRGCLGCDIVSSRAGDGAVDQSIASSQCGDGEALVTSDLTGTCLESSILVDYNHVSGRG